MNTDHDRDRGVLSPADREYLLGERTFGHDQSRRNAEARIRQRLYDAALDFDLILHTLPMKDRKQLFERTATDAAFRDGLRAMIAFVYLGTETFGGGFEDILLPAVRSSEEYLAATDRSEHVSVDVTFDVETTVETAVAGAVDRLAAGEPITPQELFAVVMNGEYDVTDHDRLTLIGADDDQFLDRLASYLDGEVEQLSESRAIIKLDSGTDADRS